MLTVFFVCDINRVVFIQKEGKELKKKNKVLVFLIILLVIISLGIIMFVFPLVNEQREKYEIESLNEDDIYAEALIVGNGSEKGLVKVRVVINNSENKITKASISGIYDEYARNFGKGQHFAGNIHSFSEMKIEQDTDLLWTEFEVSKNKKLVIKIQVQNKWNLVDVRIPLNTW